MPWTVHRHLDAAPQVVWSVLVDLDAWPTWGPTVTAARVDAEPFGLGSRGHVRTPVGLELPFEVTRFVEGREWAWQVGGIPATTHSVRPEAGGCRLSMGAPLWAPGYLPVLAVALARIEAMTRR